MNYKIYKPLHELFQEMLLVCLFGYVMDFWVSLKHVGYKHILLLIMCSFLLDKSTIVNHWQSFKFDVLMTYNIPGGHNSLPAYMLPLEFKYRREHDHSLYGVL